MPNRIVLLPNNIPMPLVQPPPPLEPHPDDIPLPPLPADPVQDT